MERNKSLKLLELISQKMENSQSVLEYACLERHGLELATALVEEGTELEKIPWIFRKDRKSLKEIVTETSDLSLDSLESDVNLYDDVDNYVKYCEDYIRENSKVLV